MIQRRRSGLLNIIDVAYLSKLHSSLMISELDFSNSVSVRTDAALCLVSYQCS